MFQTEPIHALQALASDVVTASMVTVSWLGYAWALVPILVVIVFAWDFRRGFLLVQIAIWTGLLVDVFKAFFALPRPDAVDATLLQPGDGSPDPTPFTRMGAAGFWEPLPAEVVAHHRALADPQHGFPSGHCAITTSLWGSAALVFRRPWLCGLAAVLILLMPLSRMYLARHFLADVLGGVALGLLVIAGAAAALRLGGGRFADAALGPRQAAVAMRPALWLGAPLALLLLPGVEAEDVARLLGVNLGLWLLGRGGLPEDGGAVKVRIARVLLAVAVYFLTLRSLAAAAELLGGGELAAAAAEGVAAFALTWGAVTLCFRLGLYRRAAGPADLVRA